MINVDNLRNSYPDLIAYLEKTNYSEQYIKRIKHVISRLFETPNAWDSYLDLCNEYVNKSSRTNYYEITTAIGAIMRFDLYGKYPDGRHSGVTRQTSYKLLTAEFRKFIDYYIESENERCKLKASTIDRNARCTASFFLFLQSKGIAALADATEDIILAAFITEDGIFLRGYTVVYCIKSVLCVCERRFPGEGKNVLSLLPKIKRKKKNYPFLTKEESKIVSETLKSESVAMPLRDKAIGIIAYYTGLRWCDIATLELRSIDWERELIIVKQSKTGIPLEIPLTVTVGNAIYDYLTKERPPSTEKTLFFTYDSHPKAIRMCTKGAVAIKMWSFFDIRKGKGERKGFHIFRHHFATTLLERGIPQPIISSTLGQLSPKSLDDYLSADIENLKSCALSIESFPDAIEGVFDNA